MSAVERFAFRALRADGSGARGVIAAHDRDAAAAELSASGLFAVDITPAVRHGALPPRRISPGDLALGLRVLATLVDAGLPLRRIAQTFATLAPASWAPVAATLGGELRSGRGLSTALADAPVAIPPVTIGIIRAGEAGAGLAPSLRAAAELAEQSAATRATIRAALAYPAVLALAGLGSTFVLVGVVLPRFAAILTDLGQQLPPTTRFVMASAAIVRGVAVPSGVALLAAAVLFRLWLRGDEARERWGAVLLRVPVIGAIRHSAASARASAALAALLGAGVPLPSALTQASAAAGDAAVGARLLRTRATVVQGCALAAALADQHALTEATTRLVRAGEESGQLASLLAHAAKLESEQAATQVNRLVRLLEPALIVLFAGLVALVAAALLQAVYTVRPA